MKFTFNLQYFLIFFLLPLFGILLIPYFQYELTGDGISYISIAEKYLSGNFKDAIIWNMVPAYVMDINVAFIF